MEFGTELGFQPGRRPGLVRDRRQLGHRHFAIGPAALAEGFHLGQVDRQVVPDELEHPRLLIGRRIMDEHAIAQPQDDRVGIVGGHELAMLGGHRDALAVIRTARHEDARQLASAVAARLDPDRHLLTELGELADLYGGAERPRTQLEAQPFIGVARIRLDETNDREIEQREGDRIIIGHPEQPAITHADRAEHVELGRQGELTEGEQAAEHQPDRDAERHIFRDQIGEHPPDDADRAALRNHEVEQPQHLVERQQHRRDHQRREQRCGDQFGEVAIGKRVKSQFFDAP